MSKEFLDSDAGISVTGFSSAGGVRAVQLTVAGCLVELNHDTIGALVFALRAAYDWGFCDGEDAPALEEVRQVINALNRAADDNERFAAQLMQAHNYDAQFPADDAEKMRIAVRWLGLGFDFGGA